VDSNYGEDDPRNVKDMNHKEPSRFTMKMCNINDKGRSLKVEATYPVQKVSFFS
jgi:hypothetical protein